MYGYAIRVLEAEIKTLQSEMKDSVGMANWFGDFKPTKEAIDKQNGLFNEVVVMYQTRINDLQDALDTLKSIADGDGSEVDGG